MFVSYAILLVSFKVITLPIQTLVKILNTKRHNKNL